MLKKIGIILFFLVSVGARHAVPLRGLAFADVPLSQQADPCPPECVTDSMEIVTWYPSPYNEYEELRLYPKFSADESDCNSEDKLGLMYYNKDEQALKICWQDPSDLSYSWEKIGSEQSGLSRLGNYATSDIPSCSSAILGSLVYDTTEKRPYVCAQDTSNAYIWKPLDSDNDRDGVTDAVDYNDNDANDATATEADVAQGKTFYSGGVQPKNRKTGTLNAIKGVFAHREVGMDASRCGGNSSCRAYLLYSSVGEVSVDASYSSKGECCYTARPFRCKSPFSERSIFSLTVDCGNPYSGCSYVTHICE